MFLLETVRSIALFGLLSVSRRCFSDVLADRWWPFWRQAMHQLKLVPQIHSCFKWLRCSPSTFIHWCCVHFAPAKIMAMFRTAEEMTDIVAFWGSSFPKSMCYQPTGFVGPFVQNTGASWSMATTDEGGKKLKNFSTLSFPSIWSCRSWKNIRCWSYDFMHSQEQCARLWNFARRKKQIYSAAADSKHPELYEKKLLDGSQ